MDIQALAHSSYLHFAVTKLRTDGSRFLYINYLQGGTISRYKVTGTGIVYDNYTIGDNDADLSQSARSEMELVTLPSGNYRIAVPYSKHIPPTATTPTMVVYVADIDVITGNIIPSTAKYIPLPTGANPHGLEFSLKGRYLYVSHTQAPYFMIGQDFDDEDIDYDRQETHITASNRLAASEHFGKMFPNPSNSSFFYTTVLQTGETGFVEMFDLLGKRLQTKSLKEGENNIEFTTEGMSNGIYFYKVTINGRPEDTGKVMLSK
ncbi:MAG: T9SS type A sorting domain-containing protein [Bacteroidia bacterium]